MSSTQGLTIGTLFYQLRPVFYEYPELAEIPVAKAEIFHITFVRRAAEYFREHGDLPTPELLMIFLRVWKDVGISPDEDVQRFYDEIVATVGARLTDPDGDSSEYDESEGDEEDDIATEADNWDDGYGGSRAHMARTTGNTLLLALHARPRVTVAGLDAVLMASLQDSAGAHSGGMEKDADKGKAGDSASGEKSEEKK